MNTNDTIHRARLLAVARRWLSSPADAEDAVQDALVRSLTQAALHTPQAWLTTVVRHLAIDRLRQQALEHGTPADEANAPSAETVVARAQEAERALRRLADTLPPAEAAMVLLREVFGCDYREIAQRTGKAEATCRQAVHRALARLRASPADPRRDEPETTEAVFMLCRRALRTGSPAPLYALIGTPAISAQAATRNAAAADASRSSRLVQVEGRYLLVLMHEGEWLCCMPVGVTSEAAEVA